MTVKIRLRFVHFDIIIEQLNDFYRFFGSGGDSVSDVVSQTV